MTSQTKTRVINQLILWGSLVTMFVIYPALAHNYFSAVMP